MKTLYRTKYGKPDVLSIIETPVPLLKSNEVRIRVHACALNSWDWDQLVGRPLLFRLLFGLFKPKQKVLGADVAGVVEEVGRGVTSLKVGDEVVGDISHVWGGFAEFVCADEKSFYLKPKLLSWAEAASVPQAAVLAYQSLYDMGFSWKGKQLLINGAGGGVGTFALQYAKREGLEVTCVDSEEKLDALKKMGADHVIDFRKCNYTQTEAKYDWIIDVVANQSVFAYSRALNPGGCFVMNGGKVSSILQVAFLGPLVSMITGRKMKMLIHQRNKHLEDILNDLSAGKVRATLDSVYSLSEASAAFRKLGEGKAFGKVVVKIVE
ncbi:MAG: NAD(P)-dependent alcohol dehydrogenase [Flavobacteriales bacterium]|nr:NAD(P)-dependent alcohol dehydrogenase [Flavobacteriales bacterium]